MSRDSARNIHSLPRAPGARHCAALERAAPGSRVARTVPMSALLCRISDIWHRLVVLTPYPTQQMVRFDPCLAGITDKMNRHALRPLAGGGG